MADGYAWGLDCGSLRLGLGVVDLQSGALATSPVDWRHASMDTADSLVRCFQTNCLVFDKLKGIYPPATIAFEVPTGRSNNPSLMFHTGVIVLAAAISTGRSPWRCAVSEWKKVVSGAGNMPKADLVPWGEGISLTPTLPTGEPDYDQLAAAAIAAFAASTFGLDLDKLHVEAG